MGKFAIAVLGKMAIVQYNWLRFENAQMTGKA